MSERKRGIKPAVAAIIFLLIAAIGVGGGYLFVNNGKKAFAAAEAEMPESAISAYLAKIKNNDFDGIFEDSLIVEPHMNSKEDYIETLKTIYEGVDPQRIQFAKEETGDDTLLYDLVADKKLLATVHLKKADDGTWMASTIFSGDNDYFIEVPTGLKCTINGNELTDQYMLIGDTVASNFLGLGNQSEAPRVDRYEIDNLLGEPTIEVQGETGYGTLRDVVNNIIYVGKVNEAQDVKDTFINDAKICAMFPARDTSLGAVQAISVTDSDWYKRIRTMQNDWFTAHSTSTFSNENAFNIIQQSENSMVGYVTFDYYAANSDVNRTWHSGFQISFLKQNGTWKIAGMGTDSTLNPANQ